MGYRDQDLVDISGLETIVRVSPAAFINPAVPTDIEVRIWAIANVPSDDLLATILVYQTVDGSVSNYKYAWYIVKTRVNPIDIVRIKDNSAVVGTAPIAVNNTELGYEPTPSGNVSNRNEVVISDKGQHIIIDSIGNAQNFNISEGDYEVTDADSGIIMTNEINERWRLKTTGTGTLNISKL